MHTDIQVCEGWGCGWRGCECGSVFITASIWCLTQAICSHTSTRWHYNVRTKHQTIFELFTMTFMYFYNILSPGPVCSLGRGQIQPLNLWPQLERARVNPFICTLNISWLMTSLTIAMLMICSCWLTPSILVDTAMLALQLTYILLIYSVQSVLSFQAIITLFITNYVKSLILGYSDTGANVHIPRWSWGWESHAM